MTYTHLNVRNTIAVLLLLFLFSPSSWGNPSKPLPISLPKQTPLSHYELDANNVILTHQPDGTPAYNVFEIAVQAMEGSDSVAIKENTNYKQKKGLLPRMSSQHDFSDPKYQLPAYHWLEQHAHRVEGGALLWYYEFDNAYNDVEIKAPWSSAFGQAYVVQAFLHAFEETGKKKYRKFAIGALKAYQLSIKKGGFQSHLADGSVFFEEVPTAKATHILNGHMVSTIALLEAGRKLHLNWAMKLGMEGVETLQRHLKDYDLGYWSRYDMNPKKGELLFRLSPHSASSQGLIKLDQVSLVNSRTGEATVLDVGSSDDAVGAWRISGTEWGQIELVKKKTVRRFYYGAKRHCKPVHGGSLQNSYLVLQLPTLTFKHLSQVPFFSLKLDYLDNAAGGFDVQIQDINHGNYLHFRTLSNATIYTSGDGHWKTAFVTIRPKDLAWFMGPDYQKYHIKLLSRLFELTGQQVFDVYAKRWKEYLNIHTEDNVENYMSEHKGCKKKVSVGD